MCCFSLSFADSFACTEFKKKSECYKPMSQSDIQLMEKDQVFTLPLPYSLLALFSSKTQAAFHVSGPRKPHQLMTLLNFHTFSILASKSQMDYCRIITVLPALSCREFFYIFVCMYVCLYPYPDLTLRCQSYDSHCLHKEMLCLPALINSLPWRELDI